MNIGLCVRIAVGLLGALQWVACAPFWAGHAQAPLSVADVVDSLAVDPVLEQEFDGALKTARWRWLRALDESAAGRYDGAREELDQAYYTLAAVDDSPHLEGALGQRDPQAEVDAVVEVVERAYLGVLPHVENLSPDSPLSLLLMELGDEILEELPADAVPLIRIHQLAPHCDLPVDANAQVASSIHFFQTRGRQTWEAWHRRSGRYRDVIVPILRQAGMPEDLFYLSMIESGFNPRAYSRAHAAGLWQFVRSTGRLEGLRIDNWVDERRDPVKSTQAAVRHLRSLYKEFGDWRLAAAAYNSGRGRVRRAIEKAGTDDFWRLELPRETRNYLPLLMAAAVIAKDPARFGFEAPAVDAAITWDQVKLTELIDLKTAARLLGFSDTGPLRVLNPELRNLFTPHRPKKGYLFNVPPGQGAGFLAAFNRMPKSERSGIYEYKVSRGDNLWNIARAFGVSTGDLAGANGLANASLIRPGQVVVIPIAGGKVAPAGSGTHTVRRGESLSTIASRYRISLRDLRSWNGITGDIIRPGDKLKVGTQVLTARQRAPVVTTDSGRAVHTVRGGESLWAIARTHQVAVSDLKRWNGLIEDVIRPGQSLYVAAVQTGAEDSYTVVRGDTLYSIARRFGVEAAQIARRNQMSLSSTLLTGMELRIPSRQQLD
ncbi:MAG: LysM peptidoglycan-binding domain-containing protein [Candidatus Latescibacteria bacterium]|nr:LysM peptidoglycan-binding domain-containing protein [Candidatus Latescibacterota bacterium]MDP7448004.1 LysM peptidoglycan-binding domain-containing protein [Candidatus Latescibacterota bacterium]HJP32209.1 LysM peptidoglycan-binding domain-containing protein [Candidatus Latescibacterota bacterium]